MAVQNILVAFCYFTAKVRELFCVGGRIGVFDREGDETVLAPLPKFARKLGDMDGFCERRHSGTIAGNKKKASLYVSETEWESVE